MNKTESLYNRLLLLRGGSNFELSSSTTAQYKRIMKKFLKEYPESNMGDINDFLSSVTPRSFYKTRSAILWWLLISAKYSLDIDKLSPNPSASEWAQTLLDTAELLYTVPPPIGACTRVGKSARKKIPSHKSGEWRDSMLVNATDGARPYIAMMYLTGCRPAELASGVCAQLKTYDKSQYILITIDGAKVTESNGQPCRRMLFPVDGTHPAIKIIKKKLEESGGECVLQRSACSVSKYVRRAREAAGFRGKYAPSAYSFRHQFSADAKQMGVDQVSLAMLLGHRSTKTQGFYGSSSQGRSSGKRSPISLMLDFSASAPIRDYGPRVMDNTWKKQSKKFIDNSIEF